MNDSRVHCRRTEIRKELRTAALRGHLQKIKALIADGADVNAQDEQYRNTALHIAVRKGRLDVIKALLEAGADPRIMNRDGITPLGLAEMQGHDRILRTLEKATDD